MARIMTSFDGYFDVGDEFWRRFLLLISLEYWWPNLNIEKVTNIRKKASNILKLPLSLSHQQDGVTNTTVAYLILMGRYHPFPIN